MQRTHHIQSGGRESGDEPPPTHVIGDEDTALQRRKHRMQHQVIEGLSRGGAPAQRPQPRRGNPRLRAWSGQRTRNVIERDPPLVATVSV